MKEKGSTYMYVHTHYNIIQHKIYLQVFLTHRFVHRRNCGKVKKKCIKLATKGRAQQINSEKYRDIQNAQYT